MSFFKNEIITKNLKKYNINETKYNIMKINAIIFDKKSHYVSIFKDYLFLNDSTDFLIQYYSFQIIKIYFKHFLICKKNFLTCLINTKIMNIMFKNQNQKKVFLQLKNNEIKNNEKKIEFSNIFNSTLKEYPNVENINTETTIDNLHVNDDITLSLDLKINNNYDYKEIEKDVNFVKDSIINKNDKTILNLINFINKKKLNYLKAPYSNFVNKKLLNPLLTFTKNKIKTSKIKPIKFSSKNSINKSQITIIKNDKDKEKEKNKIRKNKPPKNRAQSYFDKKEINIFSKENPKLKSFKHLEIHLLEFSSREKRKRNASSKYQSFSTYFNSKGSNESKIIYKNKKEIKEINKIPIKKSYQNIFGKFKKKYNKNKSISIQSNNLSPLLTPEEKNKQKCQIKNLNEFKKCFLYNNYTMMNSFKKISFSNVNSLIETFDSPKKNCKDKNVIISLNKAKKINRKLINSFNLKKKNKY